MNFDLQRQLADQLRKKYGAESDFQAPQGQMVGGQFIAPNPLQYLAAGLRSVGGMAGEKMAIDQLQNIDKQEKQLFADESKALARALRGTPEQNIAPTTPNDDEGNINPQVNIPAQKGSYDTFLNRAMESPLPQFQKIGMENMLSSAQEQAKQARQAEQMARFAQILQTNTPQQAIAAGVPPEMVKQYMESPNYGRAKVEFKDTGMGFVPRTEYGDIPENVQPIEKTGNPFSDIVVRDPTTGQIVQNAPLIGAKTDIARAGRSSINTNLVNAGPKAFDVELAKLDAKQLDQWRDSAEKARSSLGTAQRLKQAEEQGAFSGGLADRKLAAASFLNGITGITPKGLVGSELYNSEASKLVLDHVKGLGSNPSNADREFIEKTVPRLATSAEARKQMVQFIENSAQRTISTFENMDSYAREQQGLGGFKFPSAQETNKPSAMPSGFRVLP